MKISLLYSLLKQHEQNDQENARKIYFLLSTLHTSSAEDQLSRIELLDLVNLVDLFKEDNNTPPWLRCSDLIKALRHHIAQEILGNVHTEYNEAQIIQVLLQDRDAQHILQRENFSILFGMGKKAAYFASCLMMAHAANLSTSCINQLKETLSSNTEEIAALIECSLNILKHRLALNEKNVTILLQQPSVSLADGLAILSQAEINEPINSQCLQQHPEQASFLATGFATLYRENLLNAENRNILMQNSNNAVGLAHVFCQFHQLGILENYQNVLIQNAQYAHLISQLIDYLQKAPSITNLTQDIDLILNQTEHALSITHWLCKLNENGRVSEENIRKLCENSVLLDQYVIRSALFGLMFKGTTRGHYKDWIVDLTQERFDHVIMLCADAHGDHDQAANTISNYLKELSHQQRRSYSQESSVSNQTFFKPATNNRQYHGGTHHMTEVKNFPNPFT